MEIEEEISLYDSSKCPTCKTDFTSDNFITLRSTLVDKLETDKEVKKL